jgi:hypothetical protein
MMPGTSLGPSREDRDKTLPEQDPSDLLRQTGLTGKETRSRVVYSKDKARAMGHQEIRLF